MRSCAQRTHLGAAACRRRAYADDDNVCDTTDLKLVPVRVGPSSSGCRRPSRSPGSRQLARLLIRHSDALRAVRGPLAGWHARRAEPAMLIVVALASASARRAGAPRPRCDGARALAAPTLVASQGPDVRRLHDHRLFVSLNVTCCHVAPLGTLCVRLARVGVSAGRPKGTAGAPAALPGHTSGLKHSILVAGPRVAP